MSSDSLTDFKIIKQIGEGSYGNVFTVKYVKTGDLYVLKKINTTEMSESEIQDAENEFAIHQTLRHSNIVNYQTHFSEKKSLYLVLEYMDGGDLGQYIEKHRKRSRQIDERKIWNFFIQACLGIQYLHSLRILHRDLKCSNLFLNKCGELKIGDLGVAKELKGKYTETIVGTPYYLAPELCEEKPYNDKCDIWSLGCILYELCTLNHPFEAKTMGGLYLKIIRGNYEPISDNYSKEISEIVGSCLQKCSEDRPTVQEILENKKIQEMAEELGYLIPSEYSLLNDANQKSDFMTTYQKIKKEINEPVGSDLQNLNFASEDKNSKNSVVMFKIAKNINSNANNLNSKAHERNTSSKSRIAQNFEIIHKKPSLIKPIKIELFDDSSKIMSSKSEIDGDKTKEESITEKSDLIKRNNSGINKDKRTHPKFHKISPKKKLNRNIQSQITYDFSCSALDSNLSPGIENKNPNQKGSINKIEVYCPPVRSQRKYTQDSENNMVASCTLDLSTKESDNNSFKEKEEITQNGYEVIYRVKTTERRPGNNDQDQSIPTDSKQTLELPKQEIKEGDNEDISIGTDEDEITMADSTKQIDVIEEETDKFSKNELKDCQIKLNQIEKDIRNEWEALAKFCDCDEAKKCFEFFKENIDSIDNCSDLKNNKNIQNYLSNLNIIDHQAMIDEMRKLWKMETNYDQCKTKMIELI